MIHGSIAWIAPLPLEAFIKLLINELGINFMKVLRTKDLSVA